MTSQTQSYSLLLVSLLMATGYGTMAADQTTPGKGQNQRPPQAASPATAVKAPDVDMCTVSYWAFDEGKGQQTADLPTTPNQAKTAVVKGATWTDGKYGKALRFQGNNAYVELPASACLDGLQVSDYWISVWFRPDNQPVGKDNATRTAQAIVVKVPTKTASGQEELAGEGLTFTPEGRFAMSHALAGNQQLTATSQRSFAPGQWYHLVGAVVFASFNGPQGRKQCVSISLYVNGAPEGAVNTGWVDKIEHPEFGQAPWRIGIARPGAKTSRWAATGLIDDVRLCQGTLTMDRVAQLAGTDQKP